MGWVESLFGKTVALDTSPLIFYIEDHPDYADLLEPFFQAVENKQIQVVAATVVLVEVLVHPLRIGDEKLASEYNDLLASSPSVQLVPLNSAIAQLAAELRGNSKLKTPDAIHLATAINQHADYFLTNDRDFGSDSNVEILRVSTLS